MPGFRGHGLNGYMLPNLVCSASGRSPVLEGVKGGGPTCGRGVGRTNLGSGATRNRAHNSHNSRVPSLSALTCRRPRAPRRSATARLAGVNAHPSPFVAPPHAGTFIPEVAARKDKP
jgi:hypothetical protein